MHEPENTLPAGPPTNETPAENPVALPAIRKPLPHHRHGRVARLPKETRDKINEMISDGVPYKEIVEALGDEGRPLNEDIPKGFRHSAQGCDEGATLGERPYHDLPQRGCIFPIIFGHFEFLKGIMLRAFPQKL